MVSVRIEGAEQLYALNRRLKEVDKRLATKLRKSIRTGVKPAVAATKTAIKTLPITGARGGGAKERKKYVYAQSKAKTKEKRQAKARRASGLRDTIARAIKVDIKTGKKTAAVRILVDRSKLPPSQRTLPGHLDDPKGWRHPVFGDRDVWVAQKGGPWFERTIRRHVGTVRNSILAAMEDLAREVDK